MNPSTNAAPSRNFIARLFSWLFSWRIVRRLLIAFAWGMTIIVLFYAEENWRGKREWNKYRQDLEAKGEQLDLLTFIPKTVPDEQNFGAAPIVKSWFEKKGGTGSASLWTDPYEKAAPKMRLLKTAKVERQLIDLVAWRDVFAGTPVQTNRLDRDARSEAARAVLQAMTESPAIAELRAASSRPYARYPLNWDLENPWGILLLHLPQLRAACDRIQLKASAELALGNTDRAMEDVRLMLYFADTLKEEPTLVSHLVRNVLFQTAVQPVWEGLLEHRWSDAQLLQLKHQFQRYDFLHDLKLPLDGERAMGIATPELIKKQGLSRLFVLMDNGNTKFSRPLVDLLGGMVPGGWYYHEQKNYYRMFQMQVDDAVDWKNRKISPTLLDAKAKFFAEQIALKTILTHELCARLLLPALSKIPAKTAAAQTSADQAVLACALERYRLVHGQFPETLNALAPEFITQLPHDLLTGDPYKYRRNEDGSFILYSVGWNLKDDGGVSSKTAFDVKDGDWVWGRTSGPAPR